MEPVANEERYIVKLEVFEGPLDLLLYLVRKHELDIFDIPIAFITARYLEYLDLMREMNLDLAAEYLEMAATLALIKSKTLLPSAAPGEEDALEEGPDPREELIRRLLEYQKYKVAAEALSARPMLGRDTFPRGALEPLPEGDRDLASPGLFALMEAFQKVLRDADMDPIHEVSVTRISVTARIGQLVDVVRHRRRVSFIELFEGQRTRSDLVVTFLALLEMTRLGLVRIFQADAGADLHITASDAIAEAEALVAAELMEDE